MTTTRPMTERQKSAMLRLLKDEYHRCMLSPDLAKQLDKRGVAELTGRKYTRYEWQRPVATLWEVRITPAGRNVLGVLFPGRLVWDAIFDDTSGGVKVTGWSAEDWSGRFQAIDHDPKGPKVWRVTLFAADGDQFGPVFDSDRDKAAGELKEMAALAREKRAAMNAVESRH